MNSSDEIIQAPNFEVISYIKNGIAKSRLIIFPSSDKNHCYEYMCRLNRKKIYICSGCSARKKYTSAIIKKYSNGNDYVRCFKSDHVCQLRKYNPDKYKITNNPNKMKEKDNDKNDAI
uniref:Transposase n=1 Tax=Panagrolaimus sp. ES5 TaxID=591445 RepID=A0AC34F8W4_9BILA